jgi:fructoselysine and glucoselysine-specific PTS system IIB component
MIIMVRADDRLIHGMVAVSWTSHLQPQTILVANNVAAKDSFKAMTMKWQSRRG